MVTLGLRGRPRSFVVAPFELRGRSISENIENHWKGGLRGRPRSFVVAPLSFVVAQIQKTKNTGSKGFVVALRASWSLILYTNIYTQGYDNFV